MQNHLIARALVALLTGALPLHAAQAEANDLAKTAAFKAAIVPLVAGSYSQECVKIVDTQLVGVKAGGAITITAAGGASWDKAQVDLVHSPSTTFTVRVSHAVDDRSVGSNFDLTHPDAVGRTVVISVSVPTDGAFAGATATDETVTPAVGKGCSSPQLPKAAGSDLWQLASRFIHAEVMQLNCIQLSGFKQSRRTFTFTGKSLVLGDLAIGAGEPRRAESVAVSDFAYGAFSYVIDTPAKDSIMLSIDADRRLSGVQLTSADGSTTACKPSR